MKIQNFDIKEFLVALFWATVIAFIILMAIKFMVWRFDMCMDVYKNTLYCLTK